MKSNRSLITIIAVVVVLCIAGGSACSSYNSLVSLSESVNQSWAEVENQYQRRFDLIPNMVETVKGYAKHEKETYENVTLARAGQAQQDLTQAYDKAKALKTDDNADEEAFARYNNAQQDLNKAFSIYVNAVREAYPDLKANENFRELQVTLEGTENRVTVARKAYTENVQAYNVKVRSFPSNIWAGMFGFKSKPQFRAEEEAQTAPKVKFD